MGRVPSAGQGQGFLIVTHNTHAVFVNIVKGGVRVRALIWTGSILLKGTLAVL